MLIQIAKNGQSIGMQNIIAATLRTDLIPVPVTLEATIKVENDIKDLIYNGAVLLVSDQHIPVTIVKLNEIRTQTIQDDTRLKYFSIIAVLQGCESLIDPQSKLISLEDSSFAAVYKACGCKVPVGNNISLMKFSSPYGVFATYEIAKRLQEEAAVIVYRDKKLNIMRLQQLFKQEPVTMLDSGAVSWIDNPKIEQREVPSFVSVSEDGQIIEDSLKNNAPGYYYPGLDARRLKNLRTVLVTRGMITRALSMNLNAGDIVLINDTKYIILTAAHHFESGAVGGATAHATVLWLATLSGE